jgi:hypothetical protein
MKRIKKYSLTSAILLIIVGSMAFLYWYGFHKDFDQKSIPPNADGIIMADVKNIRNYLFFSYLKNPSEWKRKISSPELTKRFNFSNFGIETPDYVAFFHIENQPISQWFTRLKIDDEALFEKSMAKAYFGKTKLQNGMSFYYSKTEMLFIIKHSNQILVSNISEKHKQIAVNVAEDMFLKKLFLDVKKIEKTIGTSNEVNVWIRKNCLLEEDGIVSINLEDQEITAEGKLKLNYQKKSKFNQDPNALLSLGFDFEMIQNQKIFKSHLAKINKMIGFNFDSILIHRPSKTELVLNEIIEKKDSAITYDYDDDFNPIQKTVVNTRREPSFYFSVQSENSIKIYNYLKDQNIIDDKQVFLNFPLAKTKAFIKENIFTLEANPIKNNNLKASATKMGYLQIHFNKLQPRDWRFIIAKNKNIELLKPFETLEMNLNQENNLGYFEASLKIKKGKSLIEIIE